MSWPPHRSWPRISSTDVAGPVPAPRPPLHPLTVTIPAGTRLWRSHRPAVAATAFSASTRSTRFGPLAGPDGRVIPIWYGAGDREGAVFETVFHDVPSGARSPQVLYASFADRILSPVRLTADLVVVDLSSDGLRRLRVHRSHLVESTAAQYPRTRAWAAALRDAASDAAGLTWIARQRDRSVAVGLFEDRVPAGILVDDPGPDGPLALGIGAGLDLVEELADRAGILVVYPS